MTKLSKNFSDWEFKCKCGCGRLIINNRLIIGLQTIRDHFRRPVHILSGFRCANHNRAVGGSPNSQHLKGGAADIYLDGIPPLETAAFAETVSEFRGGGIGIYNWGVHVDVRTLGPVRWDYRIFATKK